MKTLNTLARDQEIVSRAVSHLRHLGVSLHVELSSEGAERGDVMGDGSARLHIDGRDLTMPVQIKTGLRPSTVGLVSARAEGGLLIGDHITPVVGDLLRARRIHYVDSVGNASIRGPGIVIEVRGRRAGSGSASATRETPSLFTPAGLPVVLAILNQPQLLDVPLREVQERTTVSLGSVQKVVSFLRDQGYRSTDEPGQGRWRRLYDGWVAAYLAGPRDKALIGSYTSDRRPRDLIQLLADVDVTASGECAAHLAGYDIAPASLDLYVRDSLGPVIRGARLRPDPEGPVVLRRRSWTDRAERESRGGVSGERLAPAPVVYADLLALQDPRANKIATAWREA